MSVGGARLNDHRRALEGTAAVEGGEVLHSPARYVADESHRRDMRPAGLPARALRDAAGEVGLSERGQTVLGERADALGGGDADLDGLLETVRDARELLGHDIVAARGVALDGVAVAAHDALEAGA